MNEESLTLEKARELLLARVTQRPSYQLAVMDSAGRILAESVTSSFSVPASVNSAMDGYAVIVSDVIGATVDGPKRLEVVDRKSVEDSTSACSIKEGTCVRIMTGAAVPLGAEAIVRFEDTDKGEQYVLIHNDRDVLTPESNMRPAGEDAVPGSNVALKGDVITPQLLGYLVACGVQEVSVYDNPRVVIVPTGGEVLSIDDVESYSSGKGVFPSGTYALAAMLRMAGAEVQLLSPIPDNLDQLRDGLARAFEMPCDLVVTTGGVSAGDYDFVKQVIVEIGGRIDVHRLRIRPGGPYCSGHVLGIPWAGLPGNPVSTLVIAELLLVPVLRRMQGASHITPFRTPVVVSEKIVITSTLKHYLRVILNHNENGFPFARLSGSQRSNILSALARADGLLEVDGPLTLEPGDIAHAVVLQRGLFRTVL